MKPWPEEAPIEGWFPLYAREQRGFDLVEDAIENSSRRERQSFVLASGSIANPERVVDRTAIGGSRDHQLNPDKPRCTCRLRADAYVKENRGRTGEIYLDTTFHRRQIKGPRPRSDPAERALAAAAALTAEGTWPGPREVLSFESIAARDRGYAEKPSRSIDAKAAVRGRPGPRRRK